MPLSHLVISSGLPWLIIALLQSSFSTWHSLMSLWLHMTVSSHGCVLNKNSHIGLRIHHTPVWPHFNLTDYICKGPISKQGYIHSYWELGLQHLFGGRGVDTIQPITVGHGSVLPAWQFDFSLSSLIYFSYFLIFTGFVP